MERTPYPSDLTDEQWGILEVHVPAPKPGGRPAKYARREIVNGMLYLNRTGCQWRSLPHDLPPWGLVAQYFYRFRKSGTWGKINDALREQVRVAAGKQPTPSAAVIDSQSVKTTEKKGIAAATTRARKPRAASVTSSSTRSA